VTILLSQCSKTQLPVLIWFFIVAMGATVFSCAFPNKEKKIITECILPADQTGTLSGNWRRTPIPVAFHAGDFNAEEMSDIAKAGQTWNSFFSKAHGGPALDFGDPANPNLSSQPKPLALCTSGIITNTGYTGQVVIYKQVAWPYSQNAIALTSYCPSPAKPVPSFYMAIMEVNYQNFFVAGRKLPDRQSIFLHEFGHLIGLNHSCESTTRVGTPNCTSPALPEEYFYASMYPIFSFDTSGLGELKRDLNFNDQGRANCLYDTPVGS
jgi:hypothetical protein